ncbi:hypothetical protein [Streptomyces cavernae]|uniref:hypothetical protein n=1 Tax=Streptomyces cavernae TaxID=2259034 RepID=UPI000FEBB3FA|nr:hypothetical protein [Streptomyces cavernae]
MDRIEKFDELDEGTVEYRMVEHLRKIMQELGSEPSDREYHEIQELWEQDFIRLDQNGHPHLTDKAVMAQEVMQAIAGL